MNRDKALSILGLDAKATPADIKSAYRRLARANHPDKMGSAELFKLVQEAYETLGATVRTSANRKAESEREKTASKEVKRRVAERIAELQQKIVEANEVKRKAEVEYDEAIKAENWYDLSERPSKMLRIAVESEIELRVELIREQRNIRGNIWMDVVERPDVAREVIAVEWNSMPNYIRNYDWCYDAFQKAMLALKGIPYDDNDRYIVISAMTEMFGYGMLQDLIHERIKLTRQDFRAGGFFIWARRCLVLCGYHKLAVNHLSSALRIKPRLWKIYAERGEVNIYLGNYVEAINDFLAGIDCASKHNQSAMRELQYGIKRAREKANSRPQSS